MNQFPSKVEFAPQERQLAKELFNALGCKDQMTLEFILATFNGIRVFDYKQQNYGVKNIAKAGWKGVIGRMGDKLARLENIRDKGLEPTEESTEDSFGDLGVYGFIGLLCRWGKWPGANNG